MNFEKTWPAHYSVSAIRLENVPNTDWCLGILLPHLVQWTWSSLAANETLVSLLWSKSFTLGPACLRDKDRLDKPDKKEPVNQNGARQPKLKGPEKNFVATLLPSACPREQDFNFLAKLDRMFSSSEIWNSWKPNNRQDQQDYTSSVLELKINLYLLRFMEFRINDREFEVR